jgi:RNA polymerase sigma-70 factor (ECF subfamily)
MSGDESLALLTDKELVQRAKRGCTRSFGELARRYQVPIRHFLQRKCGVREDAEDLTQETFLRAFKKLWSFHEGAEFRPWIFTVAYLVALNALRRQQWQSRLENSVPAVLEARLGEGMENKEQRDRLWDRVQSVLTPLQFTVVWLFYVEQMSARDIGAILRKSEGAVKTILCRARKVLLPHLQEFTAVFEAGIDKHPSPHIGSRHVL